MSFGALFYLELILLLKTLLRNSPSVFSRTLTKKAAIATFRESLFYRNTALRTKWRYVKQGENVHILNLNYTHKAAMIRFYSFDKKASELKGIYLTTSSIDNQSIKILLP